MKNGSVAAAAVFATILTVGMARAEAQDSSFQTTRYLCERGVEVPVTYVNAPDLSLAVLNVEGTQITLEIETSASGARYGWPSDGAHYIWWTKGETAFLMWSEGGEEKTILDGCQQQ